MRHNKINRPLDPAYAEATPGQHETMALSRRNAHAFPRALADPQPVNAKLAAALVEHKQRVISR